MHPKTCITRQTDGLPMEKFSIVGLSFIIRVLHGYKRRYFFSADCVYLFNKECQAWQTIITSATDKRIR